MQNHYKMDDIINFLRQPAQLRSPARQPDQLASQATGPELNPAIMAAQNVIFTRVLKDCGTPPLRATQCIERPLAKACGRKHAHAKSL